MRFLPAVFVTVVLLVACGGGGGGGGGGGSSNTGGFGGITPHTPLPPPNDPSDVDVTIGVEYPANPGLQMVKANAAYQRGYWGQGATVALLDTGVRRTHNDLAANIVGGLGLLLGDSGEVTNTNAPDTEGDGTFVAGIIGGVRDGSRFHGVAPSVKIMPLKPHLGNDNGKAQESFKRLFRYAAENNVNILHNSFNLQSNFYLRGVYAVEEEMRDFGFVGGRFPVTLGAPFGGTAPDLEVFLSSPFGAESRAYVSSLVAPLASRDIAVVTPNDSGWHSGKSQAIFVGGLKQFSRSFQTGVTSTVDAFFNILSPTPEEVIRNFQITAVVSVHFDGNGTTTINLARPMALLNPLTFTVDGRETVVRAEPNSPAGLALAPIYHPELRGKWVIVGAVDNTMGISRDSGGCGYKSKYWCLVAPSGKGVSISLRTVNVGTPNVSVATTFFHTTLTSAGVGGDTDITVGELNDKDSAVAAAHVSGALALLKSRFPNMPMSVLVHILLSTATDLGERGIDDVYGHGLLNIARAITLQGNASFVLPPLPTIPRGQIPIPAPSDGANYRDDEFNRNWGLGAINADAAYQRGYWGQGVTVAVVDTGVRQSHFDLSANVVPGLCDSGGGFLDFSCFNSGREWGDTNGHGTHVAGIIGGVRDGERFHGVAPSVKIMPLRLSADDDLSLEGSISDAFSFAIRRNVRILNNSWGRGALTVRGQHRSPRHSRDGSRGNSYDFIMPWTEAALALPLSAAVSIRMLISSAANAIGDDDVAMVFAAGNEKWNGSVGSTWVCENYINSSGNCVGGVYSRLIFFSRDYNFVNSPSHIMNNFVIQNVLGLTIIGGETTRLPVPITTSQPFMVTVDGRRTVLTWESSSPDAYALAPIWHPQVLGRWMAVVAVETNNNTLRISHPSNGCGNKAKYWCLAAPGKTVYSADKDSDTDEIRRDGTSMAAPHVSGALALLKSRFPDAPMSVLVAVLFNTATDLGAEGVDNVYGHGLVNISAAIIVQNSAAFVLPRAPENLNPSDGRNYRDAEFNRNYGLGAINADAAYQRNYWGDGVTVAVVDSGVRGSHANLSANVLHNLARRFDRFGNARTDGALTDPFTVISGRDIGSHGTGVAGVIAGVRNGSSAYGHGVAPLAKILPLRFSDTRTTVGNRIWGAYTVFPLIGDENAAFRYALNNNVQIINNSWGSGWTYFGHYGGDRQTILAFEGPILPPLWQVPGMMDNWRNVIQEKANIFHGEDVAVVWAAGNDGWNSETTTPYIDTYEAPGYTRFYLTPRERGSYTPAQLVNNFVAVEEFGGNRISITLSRNSHINVNGRVVTISAFEPDGVGDYALAPMLFPSLRGKWLAVVATDINNRIARFSNGCGSIAKHWCLAAPGVSITTAYAQGDTWRERTHGTSFSAPHVSGALALLKSRLQNMPMSVLIAILLSTATDLGDAGVDDVYGHGLVNVSAAITAQNGAQVVTRNSGVLLRDAKTQLPPSFAAFAQRAGEVRAAVRYLDGFYYDAPLKNLLQTNKAKNTPLNFAADVFDIDNGGGDNPKQKQNGAFAFAEDGELREVGLRAGMFQVRHHWHAKPPLLPGGVGGVSTRPFYASDKGNSGEMRLNFGAHLAMFAARGKEDTSRYRQFGLSWRRDFSQTGMALSFSRINEDDTLLGGKFGGAMPLTDGGRTTQTDIAAYYKLGASEIWRAYANYRRADINASIGGIVHELSGARAEGWQLGISAQDWFSHGDAFRIGIGRDIALTGGKAILRYAKSANPQTDANTQITHNRGYRTEEKHINLSEDSPLSFSLGYGFKPNEDSRLSFGANIRRDAPSAFSIDWRWKI